MFKPADLVCVDFDDLSYDVLHNRILKATMRRLIRTRGVAAENSKDLIQLCRLFPEVQDVELTNRVFGQVQLDRNNHFYDFLMKVCELIHQNLLVSDKPGTSKFQDFVQDEKQMASLFEQFVRSFYRIHTSYQVTRENIRWKWTHADNVSERFLPEMQTDISLTSSTRKIIIECKFTPKALQHHYEAEKLRSEHLYQLNAFSDSVHSQRHKALKEQLEDDPS